MRKLMWFVIGFAFAALVGTYWLVPVNYLLFAGIFALVLAISLLVMLHLPKTRILAMILLGCTAGFLWQGAYDSFYLSIPKAADQVGGYFEITAGDYSQKTDYGGSVEGYLHLEGRIYKVKTYLPEEMDLAPGDRVSGYFLLKCSLPDQSLDSSYYRSNGVFLVAYPRSAVEVTESETLPWYGYPAATRKFLTETINATFSSNAAAFARALLLGDASDLDYSTDTAFKVSGIRHIIAVSGLHVSILFSLIFLLTGKRKLLTSVISIFVLLFFAAVAGFTPSITRACIMHGLMSLAFLFKKEYDAPTALSFAVLIMLILDPWVATNVGFQLSVGCVAGILLFSERIQNWLLDKKRLGKYQGVFGRLCRWFAVSVSVSLSATVVTTPLCALYFGMVSPVSVLTNLLTLWLVTFIFYGIILVCIVGVLYLPAAGVISWIVAIPIYLVIWIAKTLSAFPLAAVYMKSIYMVFWLCLCYGLLAVFLLAKRKRPLLLASCCFAMLCLSLTASWTEPLLDECRVTVLDVGQGQCILLQSEGKNFLVDCGGDSPELAADEAANLLMSQGIFRLDGFILTHYDADHAAGAAYLLSRVPVDCIFVPDCLDLDDTRSTLLEAAECPVYTLREDMILSFGSAQLTMIPSKFGVTDNENGLCVLFQTENYDILITGDRGLSGEAELMRHMDLPELEVLIVGHHGSRYSTGEELLEKTSPAVAIISVSADNPFGHPTQEVLDRLEQFGCIIYRTDRNGTVIFRG